MQSVILRDYRKFIDQNLNPYIQSMLESWFNTNEVRERDLTIVPPFESRYLTDDEKSQIYFFNNPNLNSLIKIRNRLNFKLFHSINYREMNKTCSYLNNFKEAGRFEYGLINYSLR
jgi:hypothetical protein